MYYICMCVCVCVCVCVQWNSSICVFLCVCVYLKVWMCLWGRGGVSHAGVYGRVCVCRCYSRHEMAAQRHRDMALGMQKSVRQEKGHWAAGRAGDIDFIGSSRTRGKVRSIHVCMQRF